MLRHILVFLLSNTYVASELLNLAAGSDCSWKNMPGKCVSVYRCLSSIIDIRNKDYPPICMFHGKEPIICCTDCELVNDTRNYIWNEHFGLINKTGQKAVDKCFEHIISEDYGCKQPYQSGIDKKYNPDGNCSHNNYWLSYTGFAVSASGGVTAYREQYPHMALLGYGSDIDSAEWLCGGSVISDRYILTAAHCVSSPALGKVRYVTLGILSRSDPPELWQKYHVKQIIPHPEYRPPSKYHDIALIETDTRIIFGFAVLPACLHTGGEVENEYASATGWGALGHRRELADDLQAVSLTKFEEEECSKLYPPHRHLKNGYNHGTQMCYGDRTGIKDTCQGDSGGPLQSKFYDRFNCVYTVLGVTSYGRDCGISAGSGIYTRVSHYVPWIESVVWP